MLKNFTMVYNVNAIFQQWGGSEIFWARSCLQQFIMEQFNLSNIIHKDLMADIQCLALCSTLNYLLKKLARLRLWNIKNTENNRLNFNGNYVAIVNGANKAKTG